jgi:hypothetical protein
VYRDVVEELWRWGGGILENGEGRGENGEGRIENREWRMENGEGRVEIERVIEGRGMREGTEIGLCYLYPGTNVLKMANH